MEIVRRNPLLSAQRSASDLQSIAGRLEAAQHRAITGLSVERPSDAGGRWNGLHGLAAGRADHEVWQEGMDRAEDVLLTADDTLSSASHTVQSAWERAIQLSNGSYSAEERQAAAAEIAGLKEELVGLANTKLGDRALFAGDAWDGDAFDATGAYLGGAATSGVRIGANQEIVTSLDGSQIFQGGVDVFQALDDLEAALTANDPLAVSATIGDLQAGYEQIVSAREQVGFKESRIDDARAVSEQMALLLDQRLSDAVGIDPAESYTELAALKVSYEAAMQITASTSGSQLFDFLR